MALTISGASGSSPVLYRSKASGRCVPRYSSGIHRSFPCFFRCARRCSLVARIWRSLSQVNPGADPYVSSMSARVSLIQNRCSRFASDGSWNRADNPTWYSPLRVSQIQPGSSCKILRYSTRPSCSHRLMRARVRLSELHDGSFDWVSG